MADTTFSPGTTITSEWLNDINSYAYDTAVFATRYGAVGDGVTDDSTALQDIINTFPGRVIDGLGRTYKCNSVLTGITSGTTLQNMTLDFSGVSTASAKYIYAAGTASATQTLSANLAVDAVTVSVPSTASFVAEGWAWLQSTAVWSTVDGTYFGQYVKVKSVDSGTQLTLYQGPIMAFNTADAATIRQITTVSNVEFHSVHIIGSGANFQSAIHLYLAEECLVANTCSVTFADYVGVNLARSVNCKAQPTVKHARAVGLAYGIVISQGSFGCTVDDGYGEDVRHYVSVGDNDGVSINCRATNNVVMYCTSSGIDSHVASFNFIAQGNQIVLANGYGAEGVTLQGLNGQAIENTVHGVTGVGIFMQPLVTASGYTNKGVARGNHVHLKADTVGTPIGVYFQNEATAGTDWEAGDMDGNFVYGGAGSTGSIHFYILANKASGEIRNLTVRGNISVHNSLSQALYVRALGANSVVSDIVCNGNVLKTSGLRAIYVLADGAGSAISNVIVDACSISGGSTNTVGVIGSPGTVTGFSESDNIYTPGAGNLFGYSGTVLDLRFSTARRSTPKMITDATGSTVPYTDTYIFDRAGTVTFTIASAATFIGREIMLRTIQAQLVNSAGSDVIPLTSATAGTAILPATDGAWCILKSDGTNWQTIAGSAV